MSEKLKVKVWLNIGVHNADQDDEFDSDFTESEWDAMTKKEQDEYLDMVANDHASNHLDCGAAIVEHATKE